MGLHQSAYAWACMVSGERKDLAEDILQNSYALVVSGKARFDSRSSLKTWLFSVIRNVARRQLRGERLRSYLSMEFESSVEPPTEDVVEHEFAAPSALDAAMRFLPQRQKEVLFLVAYRDFTLAECAQVLRLSVGSVRTHYQRAKNTLRRHLEEGGQHV